MKRLLSNSYLFLLAGVLTLVILAISAASIWRDRQVAWQEAEQSSRNLLTALTQDIGSNIVSLHLALKRVVEDASDKEFISLPPHARRRILFDRATTANYMGSVLVLDEAGNSIVDAGSILPRLFNASDREYFTVHKSRPDAGLYLSRPFASRLRGNELSIALSLRLSQPDGSFGGVVVSGISLSKIHDRLKGLDMGRDGSITLFRDDGIVLVRQPYLERQINQDLSDTPNVQRFIRESSGTFDGTAALDGVRRLYTFKRIDGLPLFLTVSKGVDEFLAPWRQKALIQSGLTLLLCAAVMGLTYLFQRELRRRTSAEAKLVQLASTDDLTGLANRRTFREFFERERRQAIRTGSWLSLLYVDADFFKAYNDHYGHGKGDDLLCAIASTLKEHVERPRDLAARYGGEEFTVLLPDTDPSGARMIAEEIREAIMLMGIEHKRSSHGLATVSIGIASARPSLSTPADTLLEAADNALYQAKAAGRNCVRLHHTTLAVVHPVEAKAE